MWAQPTGDVPGDQQRDRKFALFRCTVGGEATLGSRSRPAGGFTRTVQLTSTMVFGLWVVCHAIYGTEKCLLNSFFRGVEAVANLPLPGHHHIFHVGPL